MAEFREIIRNIQTGKCPEPPIDHLTPQADRREEVLYDRKNGNPGPRASEYEVVNQRTQSKGELTPREGTNVPGQTPDFAATDTAPEAVALPLTETEQIIYDAMTELKSIFPEIMEHWLKQCVVSRMVEDKWDLARTAWYIFENENVAPRKIPKVKVREGENLQAQREKFFNFQHEADNDYRFFAEMKLAEMFPKISTLSIRQLLEDFRWHFMPTAITLAEALEEYFQRENKRWEDFRRHDQFYVDIVREDRPYRYWMRIIGGVKYFSKKKGRMMGMPRLLLEELKMVETWLQGRRRQRLSAKLKREAEEEHARLVAEAKERGETSECLICGSDYRTKEDAVQCTNDHSFCFKCLRSVCWEIVGGQAHISLNGQVDCFDGACNGKFTFSQLQKALEPEHLRRIEEIHLNAVIAAANLENLIKCDHCLFMAIVEMPVEENRVFTCQNPKCGRQVCRLCGEIWKGHEGRPCRPKETSTESLMRMKYEEALSKILMRTCPRCTSSLVKNEGCNMVVCRCRTRICYLCQAYDITYAHFCKHTRSPGQTRCVECEGCALYEDSTARDQKKMKELQLKHELERLNRMESATPSSSDQQQPPKPAESPVSTPAAAPGAPNAAVAFQRQFG